MNSYKRNIINFKAHLSINWRNQNWCIFKVDQSLLNTLLKKNSLRPTILWYSTWLNLSTKIYQRKTLWNKNCLFYNSSYNLNAVKMLSLQNSWHFRKLIKIEELWIRSRNQFTAHQNIKTWVIIKSKHKL